jgi:hypothetical protein
MKIIVKISFHIYPGARLMQYICMINIIAQGHLLFSDKKKVARFYVHGPTNLIQWLVILYRLALSDLV